MYVSTKPTNDLAYSPTLLLLFLRLSVSVTVTKMTNTETTNVAPQELLIFFSMSYTHIIVTISFSTPWCTGLLLVDHFVLINAEKQKQHGFLFCFVFWARSNSAQHHMLPKQSSSLFLVPLGQQLIGSHVEKPRHSPVHCSYLLGTVTKPHTWERTRVIYRGWYNVSNVCLQLLQSAICRAWQMLRRSLLHFTTDARKLIAT